MPRGLVMDHGGVLTGGAEVLALPRARAAGAVVVHHADPATTVFEVETLLDLG